MFRAFDLLRVRPCTGWAQRVIILDRHAVTLPGVVVRAGTESGGYREEGGRALFGGVCLLRRLARVL